MSNCLNLFHFSTYSLCTFRHLSHLFTSPWKPAANKSFGSQPRVSSWLWNHHFQNDGNPDDFLCARIDENHWELSRDCTVDVPSILKEIFATVPAFVWLCAGGHCHPEESRQLSGVQIIDLAEWNLNDQGSQSECTMHWTGQLKLFKWSAYSWTQYGSSFEKGHNRKSKHHPKE